MQKRLRLPDLIERGVANNGPPLRTWIKKRGFPPGQLTGPNSRTWSEAEVQAWLDSRPTAPKPTPKAKNQGHPRKADHTGVEA